MTQPIEFDIYRKRQATLLYHYASMEYLRGLKDRIAALIQGVDFTLDEAQAQGRDELIANARWGVRDTAANWSTYAFPALKDFQKSTIKLMAYRATERYCGTGAYQCGYMLNEHSMRWATDEEEQRFNKIWEAVYDYASKINRTTAQQVGWDDFSFTREWHSVGAEFSRLPQFRVRFDVEAETGKRPPRTGVYVPQDDPLGALQFGWTGDSEGALREATTLNTFGFRAMHSIGRKDMWINEQKMAAFANLPENYEILKNSPMIEFPVIPNQAGSDIALNAFTTRPCKWYFVELLNDQWEMDSEQNAQVAAVTDDRQRGLPSQPVPVTGFWHTPALQGPAGRRLLNQGERFPDIAQTPYGAVIWYFDPAQQD